MSNTPEIRFKGFEGEWEEKTCAELYTERNERGDDALPILSVSIHTGISNGELGEEDLGKVVKRSEDKSKYKKVYPGDLIFNMMRAWQGAIGVTKALGMVSPAYITAMASEELYPLFMDTYMRLPQVVSQIDKLSYGVTDFRKRLYWDSFEKVTVYIPSTNEQHKICGFYQALDPMITLHQHKLDSLKTLKQSMLQKMFPKNGEKVPEIRFAGLTGEWQPYDMGELYTERNEKGNNSLPILSVSIHSGVSDGELDADTLGKVVRRSEDKSMYKHVYAGDLIFNMMRAWQGAIGVAKSEGMISPAYISAIPGSSIYPPFMNYMMSRQVVIEQIDNLSYGVTDFRKRLYWDSFVKVKCLLPSVEEQEKIADALESIDTLIASQQQKLDQLKTFKSYMLQHMFPQE